MPFPGEDTLEHEHFHATPVLAIARFLECFDEDGRQAYDVPRHVLEALAQRFIDFKGGECATLDKSFGGSTRRQRNAIKRHSSVGMEVASNEAQLPPLVTFPVEVEVERERFRGMPVLAIARFLECFDEDGRQAYGVPPHVLEDLARSFRVFMRGATLDAAFGGATRRQRNSVQESERNREVLFALYDELDKARKKKRSSDGTPFERAVAVVAKRYKMSEDNVRRIYKAGGSRSTG